MDDVEAVAGFVTTHGRRLPARRALVTLVCTSAAVAIGVALASHGGSEPTVTVHHGRYQPPPAVTASGLHPHPRVVIALAPGETPPPVAAPKETEAAAASSAAGRAASDAEVRRELTAFRRALGSVSAVRGAPGKVLPDGRAVVPFGAPPVVAAVISAGNEIATRPYKWGGGHGAWADTGYDCSGSLSFALAGAGLVNQPYDSTGFMSYGLPGPGRWITIFANGGHTFMIVGSLRFDTSGAKAGTRWQSPRRETAGFAVRHPPGL
ncbi:MAG: hypothetical protein NVSMB25_05190 [Thermoleophilaceae bacterium]